MLRDSHSALPFIQMLLLTVLISTLPKLCYCLTHLFPHVLCVFQDGGFPLPADSKQGWKDPFLLASHQIHIVFPTFQGSPESFK